MGDLKINFSLTHRHSLLLARLLVQWSCPSVESSLLYNLLLLQVNSNKVHSVLTLHLTNIEVCVPLILLLFVLMF